jgi:LmbE family N-acetylglucosaminyl deacetylase
MLLRRVFLSIVIASLLAPAPPAWAQAAADEYDGATATGLALRRLGTTARVLHIAAHPDDENTALLARLALGDGADIAYLSLTRGEGGQNSIGLELSTALGILRSEELLAARRVDGAAQFFSRAVDYGYSKSAEEALTRWPREALLADVVEVIRRYRPDVVVSTWSGTELDGHGQHQAAGVIALEAVLAAGDPARFPEQLAAGLRPHTVGRYYRSAWFGEREPDVELNTGALDPLLGRSYHQLAMASRSRHRSQDQGVPQAPGPRRTSFHRIDPAVDEPVAATRQFGRFGDGAPTEDRSLFEGLDTLLSQRAARLARVAAGTEGSSTVDIVGLFREYEALVAEARRSYNPLAPWALLPTLLRARDRLAVAGEEVEAAPWAADDLRFHVAEELDDLRDALLGAANLRLDAVADREWLVPGETFRLELGVWNGGPAPVRAEVGPRLPAGWSARPVDGRPDLAVAPGDREAVLFEVAVPPDAALTTAYYLDPRAPATGTMYDWPDDAAVHGLSFAPGPVRGAFTVALDGGLPVTAKREAVHRAVDRRVGEYHRPIKVVPAASLAVTPELMVLPAATGNGEQEIGVRVRSHSTSPVRGELRLIAPPGWGVQPARLAVGLEDDREHVFVFRVLPPADVPPGEHTVDAVLASPDGDLDLGFQVIDYPHITPRHLYAPARARVRVVDVAVAPVRVGYVEGAADGIPAALDRLGVDWQALHDGDLADGDLGRFDVIITGIRAYELRPDLVANNRRLLEWVRGGGTLIVQYNQYVALQGDYAPWPVRIARPHGRVTDEAAPVTILEPGHPVFNRPNRIGPRDWDGWVQERGLYFLDSWDGPLTPLLAMSDPGEAPLEGGLLAAPLGQGTWVYSGLALFRQLPEGVPGAYRLLANLISLGAEP